MGAPAGIDWEWALRTGGNLSAHQKRQLLVPLAKTVGRYPGFRLRMATGRRGHAGVDLEAIRLPDSALAKAATEEARETVPRWVLDHSFRTYLFGLMLAQARGVAVDEEFLYVASILHDLSLGKPTPGRCFAVTGAEHARSFCAGHGADPATADRVGAAVAGHLTVGAMDDPGDPACFVSAGAFADLTAFGLEQAQPEWVAGVLRSYPRENLRESVLAAVRADARAVPDGRPKWLLRYAAFPLLLRLAPL